MDTCDRYELHEMYKDRLKDMFTLYSYDLIVELQKQESNNFSMQQVYDFAHKWVEGHIKPERWQE